MIGTIIKISSNKTASVLLKQKKEIKKYRTSFFKDKKYLVHYNCMYLKIGMKVLFLYYKKISKRKSWKIIKILN
ncbi:30S ribosomal protein S17 [Candidatus Vidania fulgoroideorum]